MWAPGISPGVKAAHAFGWRPTTLVMPKRQEIRGLNLTETPWATSACRGRPLFYFMNKMNTSRCFNTLIYLLRQSRNSPHFMEPEGSLPCSQQLATSPYPEILPPHVPTPYILFFWRFILILSFLLRLGLRSSFFPSGFPTKTPYVSLLSPIHATCPAHSFSWFYHLNSIW